MYETLLTREEMMNAQDMGTFYRIIPDQRDLNYDKYFVEGIKTLFVTQEFNSNNTRQLSLEEVKQTLLTLPYIRQELTDWEARR